MFDSGELTVWRGDNSTPPGGLPVLTFTKIWSGCYENRTIGVTRYYTAMQHGARADIMVRIKRAYEINPATDKVILSPYDHQDTMGYRIAMKQDVLDEDGLPACDLTLERDEGIDSGQLAEGVGQSD